jgi:hypothetical protein
VWDRCHDLPDPRGRRNRFLHIVHDFVPPPGTLDGVAEGDGAGVGSLSNVGVRLALDAHSLRVDPMRSQAAVASLQATEQVIAQSMERAIFELLKFVQGRHITSASSYQSRSTAVAGTGIALLLVTAPGA